MNKAPATDSTYTEKQEKAFEVEQENQRKLNRYVEYQKMRAESAGKAMPTPIVKDEDGRIHWVNRAQRRKLKKK